MENWINEELSRILKFQVPEDMISHIQTIRKEDDLTEYLETLLDFDNPQHNTFVEELKNRKFSSKIDLTKLTKKKIDKNKPVKYDGPPVANASMNDGKNKKKTKFVSLYSKEGKNAQVVLLKGRHLCDCEASKHELVNNCLTCGRVVCKQEGSGPCLFCGNLVCTPEEQNEINAKTEASAKLVGTLMQRSRPKGWEAALSLRNTMLEYDKNSEQRTRVTDDDSDYFNVNSVWLSESEKEKLAKYQKNLHEKKHASRLANNKMTFDFGGRQIIQDRSLDHEVDVEKIRRITAGNPRSYEGRADKYVGSKAAAVVDDTTCHVAPGINGTYLKFNEKAVKSKDQADAPPARIPGRPVPKKADKPAAKPVEIPVTKPVANISVACDFKRVQHDELMELCDTGRCLSMHQPWASLLVEGIKLHEGRTWSTHYRGRLWIASTMQKPEPEVVAALETQYRALYPDKKLVFPTSYPIGCLLGCVTLVDCLPQDEYRERFPNGESDSPHVFICSNPISLNLRFTVKGDHKIYKLDKVALAAGLKALKKMGKINIDVITAG